MPTKLNFDQYFSEKYGFRWEALKASLFFAEGKVARWNKFSHEPLPVGEFQFMESIAISVADPQIPQDADSLLKYYFLDLASICVAEALKVKSGDRVLDLCAAPGGKSLILAEALNGSGELFLNEPSVDRRDRLKKNLRNYIPESQRANLKISGQRGAEFCMKHKDSFDRILIDAPCSGEKYIIQNEKLLDEWTPRRTERLGQEQYGLLCAGILALKSGGRIVYSTCSISKTENDEVIKKLLKKYEKKHEHQVRVIFEDPAFIGFEKSDFGYWILPDKSKWGPMYFSILEKC